MNAKDSNPPDKVSITNLKTNINPIQQTDSSLEHLFPSEPHQLFEPNSIDNPDYTMSDHPHLEVREKIIQDLLHKGTIRYKEGHLVLLSKKYTTLAEHCQLMEECAKKKRVLDHIVHLTDPEIGVETGYAKVLTPMIIKDQKGCVCARFTHVRVMSRWLEVPKKFVVHITAANEREVIRKVFSFKIEEFYYVYEGHSYVLLGTTITRQIEQDSKETAKISDYYDFKFSVSDKSCYKVVVWSKGQSDYQLGPWTGRVVQEIWLFCYFLWHDEVIRIDKLAIFAPLIFFYSLREVFCVLLSLMLFHETFLNLEQRVTRDMNLDIYRSIVNSDFNSFIESGRVVFEEKNNF
ncbi:hypothetical protein WICPIJ_003911 [Wickerhamomyces pijperi]|uniref:Uncharacterized protein n=1 Tax=Wickerhamomyces pijperi TaxID=599730 RepID=A0A9P8TNG1_WICPI|nr:hypothetical protein WICPIJ_003911 [Wickerhamomyces pijperi]